MNPDKLIYGYERGKCYRCVTTFAVVEPMGPFQRKWWAEPAGELHLGYYGTGYNCWGVQTNQKYLSAMAVLATHPDTPPELDKEWALERALKALRFSLASHLTGNATCTDRTSWGHTWISSLGVERMMYAVYLLEPYFSEADRTNLQRMLVSEADWIWQDHRRGAHKGVFGDRWAASRKNVPESNLWNGALLWRAATMYPDHPHAESWRHCAHRFLINSISVPADAADERVKAGRPVKDWFEGANFFDNMALDHHGYLNVGYMTICLSNAAMLHFDMKAKGFERPESLDHHQDDLWNYVRRIIFSNGRLARIGGEKRVRYCYCQEYLLPSLMYAADQFGEPHAAVLTEEILDMIEGEFEWSGDGGFFSRRLQRLEHESPYYYTRLESDRACALAQLITFANLVDGGKLDKTTLEELESDVAGLWHEPEHGAAMHRCETRLVSVSWRAHCQSLSLCQPPDDGHLTDWAQNLTGVIKFAGYQPETTVDQREHRRLLDCHINTFDGGFVTCGHIEEGCNIALAEGWRSDEGLADHWIALAALPDGHTLLGMQYAKMRDRRAFPQEIKGLHMNLLNDLYNDNKRRLITSDEDLILEAPPEHDEVRSVGSSWLNIENRVGVIGLYGAENLQIHRTEALRAGSKPMQCSLNVEEINWHCDVGVRAAEAGEELMNVGWAVVSSADADQTQQWVEKQSADVQKTYGANQLRCVIVRGMDECTYLFAANFTGKAVSLAQVSEYARLTNALGDDGAASTILPHSARLWLLE